MVALFSDWQFEELPKAWGALHIFSLVLTILLIIFFLHIAKKHYDTPNVDKTVFCFGLFLLIIEIYKQVFGYHLYGKYPLFFLPIQFCSLPIYISLIVPFIKNKTIKTSFYYFLATYSLIAGFVVLMIPESVLTTNIITLCIHTLLWHGGMVVLGVYLTRATDLGCSYKSLFRSIYIFTGFLLLALLTNTLIHFYASEIEIEVNMFYISPFVDKIHPIIGNANERFGWVVVNLGYFGLLTLGAFLVFIITRLLKRFLRVKNKN